MASGPRSEGAGVEVVLSSLTQSDRPMCPHGPTIMFERFCNGNLKRFYACSSCRDRKVCNFYQGEEDVVSESTKRVRQEYIKATRSSHLNKKDIKRLNVASRQPETERRFCQTCHLLLLPHEEGNHEQHKVLSNLTDEQLSRPTLLLAPLENRKANAQYLFSEKTTDFIIDTIDELGFTHVLCIGVPRIHESLKKQHSMLLDIDTRFYQFYGPSKFAHYNMFNQYFFEGAKPEAEYKKFLKDAEPGKLLVLLDPPFGGLVDLLMHTLESITTDYRIAHGAAEDESFTKPSVVWFFPYFMELRVAIKRPEIKMLDYKVDYANHESFQEGPKGRKYGSPVRIFTDISPARIKLSTEEGYKYCKPCQKYVSSENQHCKICKDCTSKDGKTYIHCDVCERCVKPSRVHCFKCQMCIMPGHVCGEKLGAGCHICGDFTHKRRDCPMKDKPPPVLPTKRKLPMAMRHHAGPKKPKLSKDVKKVKQPKRKRPGQLFKKKNKKRN